MARIIHFPKKLPYLGLTYFWLLYYGVGTHSSSSCSRRRYAFNDLMDDNGSDDNDSSNSCSGIASDFLTLLRQFHKVRRYRRRRARLRTVVLGKWRPYVAKSYAESVTEDLKLRLDEFLSFWACRAPNFVYACRVRFKLRFKHRCSVPFAFNCIHNCSLGPGGTEPLLSVLESCSTVG